MIADRPFIVTLARQPSDFGDVCRALRHNLDLLRMMCLYEFIGGRDTIPYRKRAVTEANRVLARAGKALVLIEVTPVTKRQHHLQVTWKSAYGTHTEALNVYPPSNRRKDVADEPDVRMQTAS